MVMSYKSSDGSTLHDRYEELSKERTPYVNRARDIAALTIPYLYPPDSSSSTEALPDPYQSIGSRGGNNLASKFLLVTLPSQRAFFQYRLTPEAETFIKNMTPEEQDEFERSLVAHERFVLRQVDSAELRPTMFMCFKHLLVSGNVLLNIPNRGPARYFPLTHYVCKRDPKTGSPLEIIVREEVSLYTLPDEVRALVESAKDEAVGEATSVDGDEDSVYLYTYVCKKIQTEETRNKAAVFRWETWQEINGITIPDSEGWSPGDDPQWFPLRMIRVSGEDYGRGYVEEYAGDLSVCEDLSEALVEGSLIAAQTKFGVRPNAMTSPKELEKVRNGGFFDGEEGDLWTLKTNKQVDFRVALETQRDLRTALGYAFLLNTSVQRQAERVTAEEIRTVMQELQDALGGAYSNLEAEVQRPLAARLTFRASAQGQVQPLAEEDVEILIVTGFEAIDRGHEMNALTSAISVATQLLGPEAVAEVVDSKKAMNQIFTSHGVDKLDVFYTDEEIQQKQQQKQMAEMAAKLGPNAINQMGGMARDRMTQEGAQEGGQPEVPLEEAPQ